MLALGGAALTAAAEAPEGYYSLCEGKTGDTLLKALHQTIKDHNTVSYSGLWTLYGSTDLDADGKIWDMYSTKRWTFQKEQCGNYSYIGDCYNREHSFPKSWFDDASPMVSDAYHIYPTDGKVNGQRSNYPFGECTGGSYVASHNGISALGRLGASTFSGYSGTVFEPDDMYKGDFARSYFYMATCYNDRIATWDSPMLDGSSYPAFSDWAVKLLLKWSRQDEVSDKETRRNDAVSEAQSNRNPFIDHPELAEYIWGDKVGTPWTPGKAEAAIVLPAAGTTVNLGYAATGITRSKAVTVKGRNLTASATITVSGPGYTVTPATLSAEACNTGAEVTVSLLTESAGDAEGSLTIRCGDLERTVDVITTVEDGLPLFEASDITTESFVVRWISLGDAETYRLTVEQNGQTVAGYPRDVDAAVGQYTATGLDPDTEYTFFISSATLTSATRTVRTAVPVPSIALLYDGQLDFRTLTGEPSDAAELLIETENIAGDLTVEVKTPFEVSTDKTNWAQTTTLLPEEDRFYMRLNSPTAGTFATSVIISADGCVNDNAEATGTVTDTPAENDLMEDWEKVEDPSTTVKTYSTTSFQGSAAQWYVEKGGFGTGTQDKAFNGTTALRMNKSDASLALDEDKAGGIGTVSFDAAKWPNQSDGTVALAVEWSDDHGTVWTPADTVSIEQTDAQRYEVTVNRAGNMRLRFRALGGGRWFIDNIAVKGYSASSAVAALDYHAWDAYCLDGKLAIEVRDEPVSLIVYGMDGLTWHRAVMTSGRTFLDLPRGVYVVATDSFARRVLIK